MLYYNVASCDQIVARCDQANARYLYTCYQSFSAVIRCGQLLPGVMWNYQLLPEAPLTYIFAILSLFSKLVTRWYHKWPDIGIFSVARCDNLLWDVTGCDQMWPDVASCDQLLVFDWKASKTRFWPYLWPRLRTCNSKGVKMTAIPCPFTT